jgi:hypothetical protein
VVKPAANLVRRGSAGPREAPDGAVEVAEQQRGEVVDVEDEVLGQRRGVAPHHPAHAG